MIKYLNYLIFTFLVFIIPKLNSELTASSETLLWTSVNKNIPGISSVQEAFILVPADYEDSDSPLIPVNIQKLTRNSSTNNTNATGDPVNLWFIPGGPGQSSSTLEVMVPVFLRGLPPGSCIYAIDHRGLGKSTPLASNKEKELLESSPKDLTLLPQIIMKHQNKLGILTPITRALRIENVARDLLKGVELVKKAEGIGHERNNFMIGVSYGTMIARRILQIAPLGAFEAVLLDGLAPTEKIEQSNESDRILQEFCDKLPECSKILNELVEDQSANHLKLRSIIPAILKRNSPRNTCTNHFMSTFRSPEPSTSLCKYLHEFMNAIWLNGRSAVKVAGLRLMIEMIKCDHFEDFKTLFNAVHESLLLIQPVNQLQSTTNPSSTDQNDKQSAALTSDELVFEIVSTLERYDVTRSSMNICFNRKHSLYGDDPMTCPSRLFDPCKFFKMTWERKQALKGINGNLPSISIKSPLVVAPQTRIIVLAGNLDFNTPTWLSRQITAKYTKAKKVSYHEFFGYGHGIYGSTNCTKDIYHEFLNGSDESKITTENCVRSVNERNVRVIGEYFKNSFVDLAEMIISKNF